MGELTGAVPVIGEVVTAACPKVDTLLTEIKAEVNGKIEATNVKAESLEPKNVAKSGKWVNEGKFASAIAKSEHLEKEVSATENALVMLSLATTAAEVKATIKVGGVTIASVTTTTSGITAIGAFRVLATEKWLVESAAGSAGEITTGSEFAYMKGII